VEEEGCDRLYLQREGCDAETRVGAGSRPAFSRHHLQGIASVGVRRPVRWPALHASSHVRLFGALDWGGACRAFFCHQASGVCRGRGEAVCVCVCARLPLHPPRGVFQPGTTLSYGADDAYVDASSQARLYCSSSLFLHLAELRRVPKDGAVLLAPVAPTGNTPTALQAPHARRFPTCLVARRMKNRTHRFAMHAPSSLAPFNRH
jgi:hypothetical protein